MKHIALILVVLTATLASGLRPVQAQQDYQLVYFDGHIHTTHSDGSGSLADVKDVAVARGLSVAIVTNHTKQIVDVNEWNEIVIGCAELSDPNFLMIPSFEITGSEGYILRDHFLAWGVDDPFVGDDAEALSPEEFWPSPRNPAGTGPLYPENIRAWMDYVHTHGGVAVHAHTYGTTQPGYDVDFIELHNFGTVKDLINEVKMATGGAISDEMAYQLSLVMNNFAIYGNRDLYMPINVPGLGTAPLKDALYLATNQWLGAPESIPLYSWDEHLMGFVNGTRTKPIFGVANSDAHNTANTVIGDPNVDDSDVGEAKNGVYVTNLDRSSFLEAVRAGRSFATTGPNLCLTVNDAMMGETAFIDANESASIALTMDSQSPTAVIAKVDVIKNGQVWQTLTPNVATFETTFEDTDVNVPGYYRVEITSYDLVTGKYQFAWANPVFVNLIPTRTISYDYEDGGTTLGAYLEIDPNNVAAPAPVFSGDRSLQLTDRTASGTPQAYLAWVNDLHDGDQVTAGFWRYDTTPGVAPSCRIWGHYTTDANDINSYGGSAGGNGSYGDIDGWEYLSQTWTFDSDNGTRTGLVIEARTYSNSGDTVWIDNLSVTTPVHAAVSVPGQ